MVDRATMAFFYETSSLALSPPHKAHGEGAATLYGHDRRFQPIARYPEITL